MTRLSVPTALLAAGLAAALLAVGLSPVEAQPPRPDPAAAFRRGDANADGQPSRDEFLRMAPQNNRFRGNPDLAGQAFDRGDTNKDGFLTLEEYRQLAQQPGGPMPPRPGFPPRPGQPKQPDPARAPNP